LLRQVAALCLAWLTSEQPKPTLPEGMRVKL
jgi:hypothetical protein